MQINFKAIFSVLFFLLILNSNSFSQNTYNIIVNDNEFIDEEIILSLLEGNVKKDENELINLISKKLFATGNFSNVSIEINNNNLIINLLEHPLIRNINFFDNERFKNEELLELFNQVIDKKIFNEKNINKFTKELSELYKSFGYNQINIDYQTKLIDNNNLNFIDLDFFLNEGKISKINKVNFKGNLSFDNSKLLDVIVSKPKRELLFFIKKNYKEIELKKDVNRIIKFYKNNGYKDVSVNTKVEYISQKNRFNLLFIINEGLKYEFSEFSVNFDSTTLDQLIKNEVLSLINSYNNFIIENKSFNVDLILRIRSDLSDLIYNSGINFFQILINENIVNSQVNIIFDIENLTPKYVNLIHINGNKLTQDYVIRRELEFAEGDAINKKLVNDSIKNIKSLDFFTNVLINQVETKNGVDIFVEVDEKNSGDFSVGLAFGTIEGATFISKLNQRNFAGSGKSIAFVINTSSKDTEYKFAISQPRFFGKKIKLYYGLNYNFNDYSTASSYKLENITGNIGFEFVINKKLSNSIALLYELNEYEITNSASVSNNILNNEGTNAVIKFQNKLNYYNLDSYIRPQNGNQIILSSTFSPITNSKDGFIKNSLTAKKFYSFGRYIFSLQAKAANITSLQNDEISDSEKFSLGGKWLRGFDIYGAGPRNSSTSYIGGNNLLINKIDISRSLFKNSNNPVDFFIFSDVGKVFENKIVPSSSKESIRASAGYGLKLYSPIGPIGLTWGFPVLDESYDIKREFLFTIGNLN